MTKPDDGEIQPPLVAAVDEAVDAATRRTNRRWIAVLVVIVASASGFMLYLGNRGSTAEQFAGDVSRVCGQGGPEAERLRSQGLCEKAGEIQKPSGERTTVVLPPTTTTIVTPGPAGVTEAQVRQLVAAQVAASKFQLTPAQTQQIVAAVLQRVPKPADGRTPSAADLQALVAAAVRIQCGNDQCRGKDGTDGEDGEAGKDAPPITDEQFQAQLATYCSTRNDCRGADGRGITSGPDCIGTGDESYWLTRYTDGTEQRQAGPCRLATTPTETPTPTPTDSPSESPSETPTGPVNNLLRGSR